MKLFGIVAFILLGMLPTGAWAQDVPVTVRMPGGAFTLPKNESLWKPDILLVDARRSFVSREQVQIGGVRLGAQYKRVHRFGLGHYFLIDRIFTTSHPYPIPLENRVEYTFTYWAFYYERVLLLTDRWELYANYTLGGGRIKAFFNPLNFNNRVELDRMEAYPHELTVGAEYRLFKWMSVGGAVGQRVLLGATPDLRRSFSQPVYLVRVEFRFEEIIANFFGYAD